MLVGGISLELPSGISFVDWSALVGGVDNAFVALAAMLIADALVAFFRPPLSSSCFRFLRGIDGVVVLVVLGDVTFTSSGTLALGFFSLSSFFVSFGFGF